jgi:hypothetical protein
MYHAARLVAVIIAALSLTVGAVTAQEVPPMMNVDFIVMASGYVQGDRAREEMLCVTLPTEASSVSVTRRAFVPENGTDRPLTMTIRPFTTTAYPLVEQVSLRDTTTLTVSGLGGATCFSFLNELAPSQAKQAQPYKSYAQIVTIQVR